MKKIIASAILAFLFTSGYSQDTAMVKKMDNKTDKMVKKTEHPNDPMVKKLPNSIDSNKVRPKKSKLDTLKHKPGAIK